MDFTAQLAISYYKTVADISADHRIYLVQHRETGKFFVKKIMSVYNISVYERLRQSPVPGIPKIIEYKEEDGELTLIEEYINGTSLAELITDSSPDRDAILKYTIELCRILICLHSMDPPIIHRDIKPANIMITNNGHVMLLDFNAAKQFHDTAASDTVLLGTQGYAAPEQYGFGSSSPQTDIYSVGIVLREMCGSVSGHYEDLDQIIGKCTQMAPADRYQSADDLKKDLAACADGSFSSKPVKARPVDPSAASSHGRQFLPPGFRTGTIWKMIIAIPVYLYIFYTCTGLEVDGVSGAALWFDRFMFLLMFLSAIACTCNYLGLWRIMPLCSNSKKWLQILGVLLLNCIVIAALFIINIVIEPLLIP